VEPQPEPELDTAMAPAPTGYQKCHQANKYNCFLLFPFSFFTNLNQKKSWIGIQ
jgi:hypothetical protein